VSANGQWLGCITYDVTNGANTIEIAGLAPHTSLEQWQIPLGVSFLANPVFAFSPDGAYLALVEPTATDSDCAIVIRQIDKEHAQAPIVTTLTSPAFFGAKTCRVTGLTWSSDGARMSIILDVASSMEWDEAVPIARLLQMSTATSDIPMSAFAAFREYSAYTPAINPRDGRIASPGDGSDLILVTPRPGRPALSVLTLPTANNLDYHVWSAAWTPDGKSLLLEIGPHMCVDHCAWQNYVRDVYLYTPDAAA
jgi:hypothetical protein